MNQVHLSLNQVCRTDTDCRRIPHNQNARLHWRTKHQWDKSWKEEVRLAALPMRLATKSGEWPLYRPQITITFFTIRQLDWDNMRGAGKILIDALKENGGIGIIRDDSPDFIPIRCSGRKR